MEKIEIDIGVDFSTKLGGRWIELGPHSGELFFNEWLKPKFLLAQENDVELHIYMDGAKGYGSSFLDQSFGELARNFGVQEVMKRIVFHTELFDWNIEYLKDEIWGKL